MFNIHKIRLSAALCRIKSLAPLVVNSCHDDPVPHFLFIDISNDDSASNKVNHRIIDIANSLPKWDIVAQACLISELRSMKHPLLGYILFGSLSDLHNQIDIISRLTPDKVIYFWQTSPSEQPDWTPSLLDAHAAQFDGLISSSIVSSSELAGTHIKFCHCEFDTYSEQFEINGYRLASFLCDIPSDIQHILPKDEEYRSKLVSRFLNSRGLETPTGKYEAAPWNSISLEQRLQSARRAKETGKKVAAFIFERESGDTATFRYFGYNICQRLLSSKTWYGSFLFVEEWQDAGNDFIELSDAFILIRCRIRPELLSLAKMAKEYRKPISYLIDDDALGSNRAPHIIQLMANNPQDQFEQDFWKGTTVRFALAAEFADSFIVPNAFFARLLIDETGRSAYVVHSSINDEQLDISNEILKNRRHRSDSSFYVGYFCGTSSHQADFDAIKPELLSFIESHHDAVLLLGGSIQLDAEMLDLYYSGKIKLMPHVDYVTLQYLQASVDVVLAPLNVNRFSNCKSALKVFEAGIVGTPACASNSSSYIEAIDNGVSGFICIESAEWKRALELLYSNPGHRAEVSKAAYQFAYSHYYGNAIRKEAEDALESILTCEISPIPESVESIFKQIHPNDWENPFETNPLFARIDHNIS